MCVCAHSPAVQQRLQMALSILSCWWSQMEWYLTWSRPKRQWWMWVNKTTNSLHTHLYKYAQGLKDSSAISLCYFCNWCLSVCQQWNLRGKIQTTQISSGRWDNCVCLSVVSLTCQINVWEVSDTIRLVLRGFPLGRQCKCCRVLKLNYFSCSYNWLPYLYNVKWRQCLKYLLERQNEIQPFWKHRCKP